MFIIHLYTLNCELHLGKGLVCVISHCVIVFYCCFTNFPPHLAAENSKHLLLYRFCGSYSYKILLWRSWVLVAQDLSWHWAEGFTLRLTPVVVGRPGWSTSRGPGCLPTWHLAFPGVMDEWVREREREGRREIVSYITFPKIRAQDRDLGLCELMRKCFSGQISKGMKEEG